MKDVTIDFVNTHLKVVEYAKRVVRVLNTYPEKEGCKTFQYQFKRQNPSKVSVPCEDIDKLKWQADDENNLYLVIDGTYIREEVNNGFKHLVSRKEKTVSEDSVV